MNAALKPLVVKYVQITPTLDGINARQCRFDEPTHVGTPCIVDSEYRVESREVILCH